MNMVMERGWVRLPALALVVVAVLFLVVAAPQILLELMETRRYSLIASKMGAAQGEDPCAAYMRANVLVAYTHAAAAPYGGQPARDGSIHELEAMLAAKAHVYHGEQYHASVSGHVYVLQHIAGERFYPLTTRRGGRILAYCDREDRVEWLVYVPLPTWE